jgi:hypothetical protein
MKMGLLMYLVSTKLLIIVDRMVGPRKGGDVSLKILINNF